MEFPLEIRTAIEQMAAGWKPSELKKTSSVLTERYKTRTAAGQPLVSTEQEALVYAIVRMPATFAAAAFALEQTLPCTGAAVSSLLDVGSGTGAAALAAEKFTGCSQIVCLERTDAMRRVGQQLVPGAKWMSFDLLQDPLPCHGDLVTVSYMLNEMQPSDRQQALKKLWQAADQLLVILEPATDQGLAVIREARTTLLQQGAHIAAPCPHEKPCPMAADCQCRFAARVQRSRLHKLLKSGDVPYEDEPFTYMAFSKTPVTAPSARVLRHPGIAKGNITLELCTADGFQQCTVTKKNKEAFRMARNASWGDGLSFPLE